MISEEVKGRYAAILTTFKAAKRDIFQRSKKNWKTTLFVYLGLVVVGLFLVMFDVIRFQNQYMFLIILLAPAIIFAIPAIISSTLKGKWVEKYKDEVLKPIVEAQFPGIVYEDELHISKSMFNASNLFTRPDRFNGEDLFSGKLDATQFVFSEIHAEEKHTRRDKNGNTKTSYTTIFRGLFLIADFNKEIHNETYVYSSGGKWFSRFKRVRLEDPEFEDRFNVYSNDQVEARYILTPKMMQRIVDLEDRFDANMYLSFRGHHVYIAIRESYNMFEASIHDDVSFPQIQRFLEEVNSILEIINDLDLNLRIWTKR
ncbi:hypothetical protein KORDIASMS9_00110 [Kordia sp. SMS9]|uniref:DUF3137 domain-containing protein n=1 Tax=Kordia sp. SMS9 TaxID=2282170 RepID=UPI000E0CDFD8|nr:DUF3137 domain-containing protein [Kordia sp. SMS9]AXG67928.1 hypothetical protein KORDIASMS9_00110 [Kordia sp. SMS9]